MNIGASCRCHKFWFLLNILTLNSQGWLILHFQKDKVAFSTIQIPQRLRVYHQQSISHIVLCHTLCTVIGVNVNIIMCQKELPGNSFEQCLQLCLLFLCVSSNLTYSISSMTFNQYMQITSGTYYILNSLIYISKRQACRKIFLVEVKKEDR